MVGIWRFSLAFTLIAYHILVSRVVPDSTLYSQILSLQCMERPYFNVLRYLVSAPALRRPCPGSRERKVDSRAAD